MHIIPRKAKKAEFQPPANNLKSISIRAGLLKYKSDFKVVRDTIKAHAEWENMYATTIAGTLVDAQTNDIFAQGFTFQGDDDDEISQIRDYLEEVDFERNLKAMVNEARKHGYGIAEIGTTALNKRKPVALSSLNIVPRYDDKGWLDRFAQVDLKTSKEGASITLDKCMCITLNPVAGDIGLSQLARCYEAVRRHENITDASADMIWSHGYPSYEIQMNPADGVTPANIPHSVEGVTADLAPGSEFTTGMGTAIKELNTGGLPQIQNYGDWALQEVAVHFNVPRSMVGLVDNSEATAKITSKMYYNRIASEQTFIEREVQMSYLEKWVLPELGIKPKSVRFNFNDPDPQAMIDKTNYVKTIMSLDPVDAYALYDKSELAEMLGKHPKEGEYDEDPQKLLDDLVEHIKQSGVAK